MNRRSFFKFLGIGAATATAAVAPKMLVGEPRRGWYCEPSPKMIAERLQEILPNDVQVGPEFREHLKAIQEKQRQLGLDDIKALQKVKRNA